MNLKKIQSFPILSIFFLLSTIRLSAGPEAMIPTPPEPDDKPRALYYTFSSKFKPGDSLYAKNFTLLNSCEKADRIFQMKHTLDLTLNVRYQEKMHDPAAEMKFTMRNKAVWGHPNIVPTTRTEAKVIDYVGLEHSHAIPRHLSWIREGWLEMCINDMTGLEFHGKRQAFKIGAFPFQLGRGISLGDAYAVGPDFVGFYSDSLVDQYAFGALLSGEIVKDRLAYDLYGGLLQNRCSSLRDTTAKIYAQEYGRLNFPQRGFGIVNIVIAGRLVLTAIKNKEQGELTFEPYALVNTDKEQKVKFRGDATSKLGTLGLATEFKNDRFEFGFEGAVNLGHQCVKGWDNNIIQLQNKNGCLCFVNSHAYVGIAPCSDAASQVDLNAYKAPRAGGVTKKTTFSTDITTDPIYTTHTHPVNVTKEVTKVGKAANNLVNNATRNCAENGKLIGTVDGFSDALCMLEAKDPAKKDEFYNAKDRFRDPYINKYKGFMFVTDAAVKFLNDDVKIGATGGYASGDADPNFDLKDGDYRGFISLQEQYSGKIVKSAFYMGSQGKLRIPLDTPTTEEKIDQFASTVSGFTNLAFVGAGIKWEPHEWEKRFSLHSNILAFWQPWPSRKFDACENKLLPEHARRFLGVELNTFLEKVLLYSLEVGIIASLFIPGSHFEDVRGKPINKDQQKRIDSLDRTGYNLDCIPNIGTDTAFAFNIYFEYRF